MGRVRNWKQEGKKNRVGIQKQNGIHKISRRMKYEGDMLMRWAAKRGGGEGEGGTR